LLAPLVVPQVETAPADDETTPPAPQVVARKEPRNHPHVAELRPNDVSDVATALQRLTVRDACLGLSVTSSSDDAIALWHRIRTDPSLPAPAPARAEAYTLAAHHLWVHGSIKAARCLIRKAQRLVPEHRLAALLAQGLPTLTAGESRQLSMTGVVIAARLSVPLPGSPA